MKWLDNLVKQYVKQEMAPHKGVIEHFERKIAGLEARVKVTESKLSALDELVASMTYEELDKYMQNRFVVFEGNIDDKIVGLFSSVDEKISKGNGAVRATSNLLKKIAVLEGVKEAVESRRLTPEILAKREDYRKELLAMDREDKNFDRFQDALLLLNWVLGEETNE